MDLHDLVDQCGITIVSWECVCVCVKGCGGVGILLFLLPDGSKPHYGVCHNLTFTTVGLKLTGERVHRYFTLMMGDGRRAPPYEMTGEGNCTHTHTYIYIQEKHFKNY